MCKNDCRFPLASWGVLGFTLTLAVLGLSGCGSEVQFTYVTVAGRVRYDDGSLIPASRIRLTFISQTASPDPKIHPLPGIAEVDVTTGAFDVVSSRHTGDGLVPGDHKVTLLVFGGKGDSGLRKDLIPPEYSDPEKTPLKVNTDNSPFELRVRKPVPAKVEDKSKPKAAEDKPAKVEDKPTKTEDKSKPKANEPSSPEK